MSLRLSGGRKLHSPPGQTARPTPSRVRLAVMNMLAPQLGGARWLDLCCGSGVMGCEALQRGAAAVVAVDQDRRMAATAKANLALVASGLDPAPAVAVVQQEVTHWLQQAQGIEPFDLIYADPPYAAGLYGAISQAVQAGQWLRPAGLLLLECASDRVPPLAPEWVLQRQKRYGGSTVLVLEPEGSPA
ncbi:MAG: 16S rRNA (guanine(966)-N(2))-methyltransferase RsmD [Synechococcaceae bacterium WBB_3_034]|jgi:16S rRNA (guanine(966)-N(2))-methyltransferase RsmD|nr:16S rRNA (guanine(966)-N(2))-methyltransferase RsmD [Synechococcaceae bacterium WBB_3_034]NDG22850.1 16S rRNA (guanine(966)-N(2))-methyltransferase RsmD [Synechococcaceae bacterium WBB_10_009]